MTLTLNDVATHVATLGVVDRNHIYCGKMSNKSNQTVGIYNLKRATQKREVIGGDINSSYKVKHVSFLIHWNKSTDNTETTADSLYDAIKSISNVTINGKRILFTKLLVDNPIDVGTDENGIYEMVIEADFYYERK